MLPGFGFSVGDFIAALELVATVIDALRESGDSTLQCRAVIRQLVDLETALIEVRRLEFDEAHAAQMHALRRSAAECRTTIDGFMVKIRKYQPHLSSRPTSTPQFIKQSWYKISWALCRNEDLERFKADLSGHTEAINILMNAIQLERMAVEAKAQAERHSSLKLIIQDCFAATLQRVADVSTSVAITVSNSKQILDIATHTAQLNCRIFAMVLDIHTYFQTAIAPQVLRSQPVYFVDALGSQAPFHLEFIRSTEAFLFVLRDNLKDHDLARKRIEKGQFAISDIATNRDIDLCRPWSLCFRPGQRVDMSMILSELQNATSVCPSCMAECDGSSTADITCSSCGLTFRRVTELDATGYETIAQNLLRLGSGEFGAQTHLDPEQLPDSNLEDDFADELLFYRKVRLCRPSTVAQDIESTSVTESGWSRPPTFNDALTYVDKVKARFRGNETIYEQFLGILQDYQAKELSISVTHKSLRQLLQSAPDLVEEFNRFMPITAGTTEHEKALLVDGDNE